MDIGTIIKQYRTERGITLRAFAAQCGISSAYLSSLENGRNHSTGRPIAPTFDKLVKIADNMNISVDALCAQMDDTTVKINQNDRLEKLIIRKFRELDLSGKLIILRSLGIPETELELVKKEDAG
jgi:transcriptional regulator with XRE-family HTH domain